MQEKTKYTILSFATLAVVILAALTLLRNAPQQSTQLSSTETELGVYLEEIQPILDRRCATCHSCYNSPCQLNLTSYHGTERGYHPTDHIYDSKRKASIPPTRLFTDHQTTEQWRSVGFRSITEGDSYEDSVLWKALNYRRGFSLRGLPLSEESRVCYQDSELVGKMPFGLPELSEAELETIKRWLEAGAPGPSQATLDQQARPSEQNLQHIIKWERYLNRRSPRQRLIARYIYEHLFLARLHFDESNEFFTLVRSRQACRDGDRTTISEIATRRPYDHPGGELHYCFRKSIETRVHKTHIPYQLGDAKMNRYIELFESDNYGEWQEPLVLPSYETASAANPFVTFDAIPVKARFQFLLDNAQYYVMTFIRGPVCKGNTALNVIDEQFYVMFVDPDAYSAEAWQSFVSQNKERLNLPASRGSDFGELPVEEEDSSSIGLIDAVRILRGSDPGAAEALTFMGGVKSAYEALRQLREGKAPRSGLLADRIAFRSQRAQFYQTNHPEGYRTEHIWDGDGHNDNALLTVMRHYDSATVLKGAIGPLSKTIWVIDYTLLEGIYYNLVAGFDVYGDAGHQLSTRYYMSQLRLDGEEHFLTFLPPAARAPTRNFWYRDGEGVQSLRYPIDRRMSSWYPLETLSHGPGLLPTPEGEFNTSRSNLEEVKRSAFQKIYRERLAGLYGDNQGDEHSWGGSPFAAMTENSKGQGYVEYFPDASLIRIRGANPDSVEDDQVFSLIRNKEHYNVGFVFFEDDRRDTDLDALFVVPGFVGSYPMQFFDLQASEVDEFVRRVRGINRARKYRRLVRDYGIQKSDEDFWPFYDDMNEKMRQSIPFEAGLLDLNRYGNIYE